MQPSVFLEHSSTVVHFTAVSVMDALAQLQGSKGFMWVFILLLSMSACFLIGFSPFSGELSPYSSAASSPSERYSARYSLFSRGACLLTGTTDMF